MGAHFEGEYDGNGELDVFHHEDTTQMIISYLSEDAKFCFALTSKKNRERVDTWNDRDKRYLRERDDPQFRRALVLHDAAREGHLRIISWLVENLDTCVSVVCPSDYESCPLFETYTCLPRHYFLVTYSEDAARKMERLSNDYDAPCRNFGSGGDLFLSDVAARYGRYEIVAWIEARYGLNRHRMHMVYAMAIISGHGQFDRFRSPGRLSSGAIYMILQRAPLDVIRKNIRIDDFNGVYFPMEYIAKRGDASLFEEYLYEVSDSSRNCTEIEATACAAILSGDQRTIEVAIYFYCGFMRERLTAVLFRLPLRKMMVARAGDEDILAAIVWADARMGEPSMMDDVITFENFSETAHVLDRIRLLPPDKRHESWDDERIDTYMKRITTDSDH